MSLSKAEATTIRKLRGDVGHDDLAAEPKKTIAAMDARYSVSSTRVALVGLRKEYPACKEFETEFQKRRPTWTKIDTAQEPTERQEAKFAKWEDILTFRDTYRDQMSEDEYFLLCLYTMWPPVRADYTPMKVVARKPRVLEDGVNYLLLRKKSVAVLFHSYKTSKKYGDILRRMPKPLERVTRAWIQNHPGTYLFQDADGTPWQPQRLGSTVRRPFQRIHGMDTGITMIRHAYSTFVNRGMPALSELQKRSAGMLHSMATNQTYRFLGLEE
jgi:hypothetical protein